MSKSRKRRTKRSVPPSSGRDLPGGFAVLFAVDDAELRGDALGALHLMGEHWGDGKFWAPWRIRRLLQLATFRSDLPGWATSRWILAQALQHLDRHPGPVSRARRRRALEVAIELRGGPRVLPGANPRDVQCRVMDHDWVHRQLYLYELGGLTHFLDRAAPADLLAGADRIREWAATPLGGFRLVRRGPATITWEDLATGQEVATVNIGGAALVMPGECVLARAVPIEGGTILEGAPLLVPEEVATAVARDPSGWVDVLRAAPPGTTDPEVSACADIHGLLTDMPPHMWQLAVYEWAGLLDGPRVPTEEQQIEAVLQLARWVLDEPDAPEFTGPDAVDPWGCLAAALVTPPLLGSLGEGIRPADRVVFARLADLLAEPAAGVCRELALDLGDAA
jgi:hypothetical protein